MQKTWIAMILVGLIAAGCGPKPEPNNVWLDLDTTYFPLGQGYYWYYSENTKRFTDGSLVSEQTNYHFVEVTDSAGTDSIWSFTTTGYFEDLGNEVDIEAGSVYVSLPGYLSNPGKTISIVDPTDTTLTDLYHSFSIDHAAETLLVKLEYATPEEEAYNLTVARIKGKGVIYQIKTMVSGADSFHTLDSTWFMLKGNTLDTIWF